MLIAKYLAENLHLLLGLVGDRPERDWILRGEILRAPGRLDEALSYFNRPMNESFWIAQQLSKQAEIQNAEVVMLELPGQDAIVIR